MKKEKKKRRLARWLVLFNDFFNPVGWIQIHMYVFTEYVLLYVQSITDGVRISFLASTFKSQS